MRTDSPLIGFDLAQLFEEPEVCAATAAYIVYRLSGLIDGRRFAVIWDEMAFAIKLPVFAKIIDDFALTLRKKNGALFVAAQEPDHIIDSPIGASLVSQCLTKVIFPARTANREAYRTIRLTDAELLAVTEKMPASKERLMLIKREEESVVVRFDLKGLDDEILVLSGRVETAREMDEVRQLHGDDPRNFLTPWLARARLVVEKLQAEETEDA